MHVDRADRDDGVERDFQFALCRMATMVTKETTAQLTVLMTEQMAIMRHDGAGSEDGADEDNGADG